MTLWTNSDFSSSGILSTSCGASILFYTKVKRVDSYLSFRISCFNFLGDLRDLSGRSSADLNYMHMTGIIHILKFNVGLLTSGVISSAIFKDFMLRSFAASSIISVFLREISHSRKRKTILLPARIFTRKLFRLCNSLRARQSQRP